jgi:hypothetical protein
MVREISTCRIEVSPPVTGVMVLRAERQGQPVQPPLCEHVDRPLAEPIADRLQRHGVIAGGEPVGQLGEGDPGPGGLPLGPLMPVYLLTELPGIVAVQEPERPWQRAAAPSGMS